MNRLPCTVTACHGAGAKKACICFCAITLYTLRPLNNVLYPSTRFFSLRTHSLPFQTVLYSSCSSHLINLSTIDSNFQGAVKILEGLQPGSYPGTTISLASNMMSFSLLLIFLMSCASGLVGCVIYARYNPCGTCNSKHSQGRQ